MGGSARVLVVAALAVLFAGGPLSGPAGVLLAQDTACFTQAVGSPIPVGDRPISVAVGDFNGDGRLDLAVANARSNTVTILLNTCVPPTSTPTATLTSTPTSTVTPTATSTPSATATSTPTPSPTGTLIPTATGTLAPTGTATRTATATATPVPAVTPTATPPGSSLPGPPCPVCSSARRRARG